MERLAHQLRQRGLEARVRARYSPERWRALMGSGARGRASARLGAMLGFPMAALCDAVTRRSQVLVPTTNPFFLPALLVAFRWLHRQPVVPLVYDLYPDALEATGVSRPAGPIPWLMAAANRLLMARSDAVVFIGEGMGEHARARYGEPRRWLVAETGASIEELSGPGRGEEQPASELERWCEGRVVIGYVGNLGLVHDWDTLAGAIPRVLERAGRPVGVVVAASGPGVGRLRSAWKDLPTGRVRFEAPLEDRAWARLLRRTAVSVVTLKDAARNTSIPSKVFSAMAAGSCVLAVAPRSSDVAKVVEGNGVGLVCEPGDVEGAAAALGGLLDDPDRLASLRAAALRTAGDRYDLGLLAERWGSFLEPLLGPARRSPIGDAAKRCLDVVASGVGLLVLSPLLLAVALAVRATMGAPVLFSQERPGRGGRPFHLLKFRSMRHARPGEEGPASDGARLTRLGAFLRASSIDELPALLNVLRGEMSLVGPRPLLMRYLPRYSERQARRHDVRPGITGWAQVNGRNALSWEEKFELDVWYVEHRSLRLDLKIIWRTIHKVARREGISRAGHATMPEFMGSGSRQGSDEGTR